MGITWQRPADCLSRHVVTRPKVRNVNLYWCSGVNEEGDKDQLGDER